MADIHIICPNCNRQLTISEMPGMDQMYLTCPVCQFRAQIAVYKKNTERLKSTPPPGSQQPPRQWQQPQQFAPQPPQRFAHQTPQPQQPIGPQPQYAPQHAPSKPSVFSQAQSDYGQAPAVGSLFVGDEVISLRLGRNIVGRKAVTSTADVQIPTSDRYMSRAHAEIFVTERGGMYLHQLRPLNPKNPLKINGLPIMKDAERINLSPGDVLTLGHTDILFTLI